MRHKLFRNPEADTLLKRTLDNIILSKDPQMIKDMWKLPPMLLEQLDKRCLEIEDTPAYKQRYGKN